TYTGDRRRIRSDISMDTFLKTMDPNERVSLNLLRERKVYCADEDHNKVGGEWVLFKCLYAEVTHNDTQFILNGGKWFTVDSNFVARTNRAFDSIPMSSLVLPTYAGGGEGEYNKSVARKFPKLYALLDDTNKIFHGGGRGQIEVCDLLSADRQLIHVKRYSRSSVLSHLFSQGLVSGQLLQIDKDFRKKVATKLKSPFNNLIKINRKPTEDKFAIVYAIISSVKSAKLHLPFFSRVNLNNAVKLLIGFGYGVELLRIDVDPTHAKLVKDPPARKRKLL